MNVSRLALLCASFGLVSTAACSRPLPEDGPLAATSEKLTVSGAYHRVQLDSVERLTIEDGTLVLHGTSGTAAVDLPPNADPNQKNRGWALVTEGESEGTRTLTFTQETSLEDFTVTVPAADGQIAYGSLGGRDGNDMLLFAYGSASKTYWGWTRISRKSQAASH